VHEKHKQCIVAERDIDINVKLNIFAMLLVEYFEVVNRKIKAKEEYIAKSIQLLEYTKV